MRHIITLLLTLCCLQMPAALAETESTAQAESVATPFSTRPVDAGDNNPVGSRVVRTSPFTVVGGLLLIVLLIVAIAWMMKKLGGVNMLGNNAMRVVAALSVGNREKVLLVEVGDKQILLGVAPGRVSHLQSFDEPIISQASNGDQSQPNFANTINQLLGKQRPQNKAESE